MAKLKLNNPMKRSGLLNCAYFLQAARQNIRTEKIKIKVVYGERFSCKRRQMHSLLADMTEG